TEKTAGDAVLSAYIRRPVILTANETKQKQTVSISTERFGRGYWTGRIRRWTDIPSKSYYCQFVLGTCQD
ncbi:unnamed protein product, partial [Allacma fusca]